MNAIIEHEQDELILRYLRGQLAGDDKARFEIRMLEEPELLERVQLLEALEEGLRDEESALLANDAVALPTVLPFSNWIRQPLSLAACALVAVAVAGSLLRLPSTPADVASVPIRSLVLLDGNRSDLAVPVTGEGPYLLQIDAGLDAAAGRFTVVVRSATNPQVVAEQGNLAADGNGWVRLLLNDLPAGDYTVTLTDAGTLARSYRMHVGE